MSVHHHPAKATKESYARRDLDAGAHLVVAAHLEMCGLCALPIEALQSAEGAGDAPRAIPVRRPPTRTGRPRLPSVLSNAKVGAWKWVRPGLRIATVQTPDDSADCLYLLRAKPGVKLPHHGHGGAERIVILHGGFTERGRSYRTGDLIENNERFKNRPRADHDDTCICLIATERPLKLASVGRWLRPYFG